MGRFRLQPGPPSFVKATSPEETLVRSTDSFRAS
jgi:hypothetical protein